MTPEQLTRLLASLSFSLEEMEDKRKELKKEKKKLDIHFKVLISISSKSITKERNRIKKEETKSANADAKGAKKNEKTQHITITITCAFGTHTVALQVSPSVSAGVLRRLFIFQFNLQVGKKDKVLIKDATSLVFTWNGMSICTRARRSLYEWGVRGNETIAVPFPENEEEAMENVDDDSDESDSEDYADK